MDPSAPIEPTYSAPQGDFTIYCRERVLVLVPRTDGGFDVLRPFIQARAVEVGGPVSLLVLVRPGVRAAAAHLRDEVSALLLDLGTDITLVAVAIDGRGFFASTFMSIASGLFMFTRHGDTPLRAFRGVEPAWTWIQEESGDPAPWLPGYVADIRAALDSAST
ncbi:MAG: hypothetical protein KUG77_20735 [Nannocystaceae bacterium]|nr:hypothetical protein [Nannocystaceae bacterium]